MRAPTLFMQGGSSVQNIVFFSFTGYATKYCTENGTWEKHSKHGREWTDYSNCVNIQVKVTHHFKSYGILRPRDTSSVMMG